MKKIIAVIILCACMLPLFVFSESETKTNVVKKDALFRHLGIGEGLSQSSVRAITQDDEGFMWFGAEYGLNKYDGYEITVYNHQPGNVDSISDGSIFFLYHTAPGYLWIVCAHGLDKLDLKTERFIHIKHDPQDPESISPGGFFNGAADRDGRLWLFRNRGGICIMDTKTGKAQDFNWEQFGGKTGDAQVLSTMHHGPSGRYWLGTLRDGLIQYNPKSKTQRVYRHQEGNPDTVGGDVITNVMEDHKGMVWLSVLGKGLEKLDPESGKVTPYPQLLQGVERLRRSPIGGFLEGGDGSIWMLTATNGLLHYRREQDIFYEYRADPTNPNSLSDQFLYTLFRDRGGLIWIGTSTSGLDILIPEKNQSQTEPQSESQSEPQAPQIAFTGVRLFNNPGTVGKPPAPLKRSVSQQNGLRMRYGRSIFSVSFAALDYRDPGRNRYMYKLDGLYDHWIDLGTKRTVGFAGLSPGTYRLRVKACNSDGIWNHEGTSMKIVITPPYYMTWWFRAFILLTLSVLFLLWHKSRVRGLVLKYKNKDQLEAIYAKYKISEREREIVNLLLEGKSNKEIEDDLFISIHTVKTHIYKIYKKFGVKSRLELVNLLHQKDDNPEGSNQ